MAKIKDVAATEAKPWGDIADAIDAEFTAVNTAVGGKAAASHTHTAADVTFDGDTTYADGTVGAALKNVQADKVQEVIEGCSTKVSEAAEYARQTAEAKTAAVTAETNIKNTVGLEAFDSSKAYTYAQFCLYDGKTYMCTNKQGHTGEWTAADFSERTLANSITTLYDGEDVNMENITVFVTANGIVPDASLNNKAEVTISFTDGTTASQTKKVQNGAVTFSVAFGKQYIISCSDVADLELAAPVSKQYYSELRQRIINMTYLKDESGEYASILLDMSSDPTAGSSTRTTGKGEGIEGCVRIIDRILSHGSWVLRTDTKKMARLDPTNSRYFAQYDDDGNLIDLQEAIANGTAEEWHAANTAPTKGEAFCKFPDIWYYVGTGTDTNGVTRPKLMVSDRPYFEKLGWHKWEECYIGMYKCGAYDNNTVHSRPWVATTEGIAWTGTIPTDIASIRAHQGTMLWFWDMAQNGGYILTNYKNQNMLIALHLLKYGTTNSETYAGKGLQDAYSALGNKYNTTTGYTESLGDATGNKRYASLAHNQNRLFGMEALFGTTWEFRPGVRFSNMKAIMYNSDMPSNVAEGVEIGTVPAMSRSYIKTCHYTGGYFTNTPKSISGTDSGYSSQYWCDGGWSDTGGQLLLVGGLLDHGSLCGLSASSSTYVFGGAVVNIGARLAFRDDNSEFVEVSGSELLA